MGHHTGRKGFIYGTAAIERGNQLLIILSLICKFCMHLVHVAMPNRCWKRQFVNRSTRGRRINAEAFSHTIFFWYEMIIVNAWHSEPVPGKGRPTTRPPLAPSVRHLSFSVATDKFIYENVYCWDKYLFRNGCLHIQHHKYKRTGSLDLHMWRHVYKDHLHIRQYLGN